MRVPVFLSYPRPHVEAQQAFIDKICGYLDDHGFAPRTLGVTDYDVDAPLKAISAFVARIKRVYHCRLPSNAGK